MALPIPASNPDMVIDDKTRGDFFDSSGEEDENLLETGAWLYDEDE